MYLWKINNNTTYDQTTVVKMSSWIPSLFNPPPSDDHDDDHDDKPTSTSGVKQDLSAVFRGVASFLAPPPHQINSPSSSSSDAISGIKNDLAEIEGSFRSGLSLISSKLNSNFLQFKTPQNDGGDGDDDVSEEDEDEEDVVGINEEVVAFVGKICGRPELWTDFPLASVHDLNLSDYQKEHAASIGNLVPELVTLRQNLSSQISSGKFWLIYFILLFPWLDEEELKLLSTPQVVEARQTLLKKLQDKTDADKETSENLKSSATDEGISKGYSNEGGQNTSQNKDVAAESSNETKHTDTLNEIETGHHTEVVNTSTSVDASKQSENEDVSFSDLEDDDNDLPVVKESNSHKASEGEPHKRISANDKQKAGVSGLREKESEGEESNDWLTVDDADFDSLAEI